VQEEGDGLYLSLNPQKCIILLKIGIGFQVKIVLLLKIRDFRAGKCIPPWINLTEKTGGRMLPEFPI
jgi:hypothetical protein